MKKSKKIIVSFVNDPQSDNLEKMVWEAEASGLYEEIKLFTNNAEYDIAGRRYVPFSDSKPQVLLDILKSMDEKDILLFSESLTLDKRDVYKWYKLMSKYSALFFFYGKAIDGMKEMMMHDFYFKMKVVPTCIFDNTLFLLKKSSMNLIKEWQDCITGHSENLRESDEFEKESLKNIIYNHLNENCIRIVIHK